MSIIVGTLIGIFFFITLWSALGLIKSLLITVLTLIGMVFILALAFIVLRMVFDDTRSMLEFITGFRIQLAGVMAMVGFFL